MDKQFLKKWDGYNQLLKDVIEYGKWVDSLYELDRINFETLITLPNAEDVINKIPDGQYKKMAKFGLIILQTANDETNERLISNTSNEL